MDKHERPYKCEVSGCEKLQGFTYSGGLLRHQREVHKMHGGAKEPLFCPFQNCKRHAGSGFTRKENLHEHIRRVHRSETNESEIHNRLKRGSEAVDSSDAVGVENIDPGLPSSNSEKRRRVEQTSINVAEWKGILKNLCDSNEFLLQQNADIRRQLQFARERLDKMESRLGLSV
jgi:hypothetical protein